MKRSSVATLPIAVCLLLLATSGLAAQPVGELILPLEAQHNHGSSIVEGPSGMLLVSWFRGSGERTADDVAIYGATKRRGSPWSEPFVLADTPGFPDTNCTLLVDSEKRLWLFWPTILDNRWESALMKVKVSNRWDGLPEPMWSREFVLHMKPGDDFPGLVRSKTSAYLDSILAPGDELPEAVRAWADRNASMAEVKLTRRLGWFTRPHPIQLSSGRLLVGLYSDGFSFSMATFSDDEGDTWSMSEPIVGGGNVQPSLVERADGSVLAFMRDNGPAPKQVQVSTSQDGGATWSVVADHPDLVDSGSGVEALLLSSGKILMVHNDLPEGRHRLALSISEDGGKSFRTARYLEDRPKGEGRFHYPSAAQGRWGAIHVTYSYHLPPENAGEPERKSIRHVSFREDWLLGAGSSTPP
jgi:predicted neuraminidase